MSKQTCQHEGVSRRGFLHLTCGCALAAATFGKAYANTDPIMVAQATGAAASGKLRATYLGHSAYRLVTPGGKTIYVDPWLSNPKAPADAKQVSSADLIMVSHAHADHLGETVEIAKKTNARVLAIVDIARYLGTQGIAADKLVGMGLGGTAIAIPGDPLKVMMIRADHSSTVFYTDPQTKVSTVISGGQPAGFILQLENGFRLLHAGDTALYTDMQFFGQRYKPDVAMLPIGDFFTMGPEDAALAAKMWGVKAVIPIHYGTFPLLTGTVEAFRKALDPQITLIAPAPGDTVEL